jgi:hypothetical protein
MVGNLSDCQPTVMRVVPIPCNTVQYIQVVDVDLDHGKIAGQINQVIDIPKPQWVPIFRSGRAVGSISVVGCGFFGGRFLFHSLPVIAMRDTYFPLYPIPSSASI